MRKIEYLFYCAVLNGVVLLAGLFIFYLAGRYGVDIAAYFECAGWEIRVILIAMLAAELGVGAAELMTLAVWVKRNWNKDKDTPPSGGRNGCVNRAEATATAVAETRCQEENDGR